MKDEKHPLYDSIPNSLGFIVLTCVVVAMAIITGCIWVYEVVKHFK